MDIVNTNQKRRMDDLGRIVIPKMIREEIGLPKTDNHSWSSAGEDCEFEIFIVDGKDIMLKLIEE